ncbi:uncharacterized protein LOC133332251 [Musca vetustissima]|uniref:uncharacterized protein LOC133332251 n=1 Tax=Musca vetustissima TaxID=27455 RepID=UPI002AB6A74C|nr:uncharacterized protein LOC133332251 [Musca vetustissima]
MVKQQHVRHEHNSTVYKETTEPKKRDKSDLGPNFIAPDGGWGWVVCIAAGLSNLSLFPALMQYALVYRERMIKLNFDAKQIATIINAMLAISSLVGLVNGAMFRRFSFRQVAIVGSCMVFAGVLLTVVCESFLQYIICYSTIYGIGLGLTMSANALAVNVYFENKRRKATGFSWTLTGLGPIIFPHISIFLLTYYGSQGTILVYAGISLHTLLSSLTLQPVQWHTTKQTAGGNKPNDTFECEYCQYQRKRKRSSIFSGGYPSNDENNLTTHGYEIIETGTPIRAGANDGWFGSKMSLTAASSSQHRSMKLLKQISKQDSIENGDGCNENEPQQNSLYEPNSFHRGRKISTISMACTTHCTCAEEKRLLLNVGDTMKQEEPAKVQFLLQDEDEQLKRTQMSCLQKVAVFFDLDLLKDLTFINLVVGMTIMMFGEVNFSVLTPFILNSFGYNDSQISIAMSLLAGVDIAVRFLAPFALERVKITNSMSFAIGILAITVGRMAVTLTNSYYLVLAVFILIGFGKGLRMIFAQLLIPSYVPLNRLAAASGLQLIFNSIVSFTVGPLLENQDMYQNINGIVLASTVLQETGDSQAVSI